MTTDFSHPAGLLDQKDYWPVAVGTGSRVVTLAGQVGVSAAGAVEAADLAGQIHSALRNVATGVRGAGGDVHDIARLTFYVVGWTPDLAEVLFEGVARAQAGEGYPSPMPPLTLIGVQALWSPELLVEIEAIAVLD
ncbi:RidA family protein [Microcella daejeonensis]|uniref:RidA family protein n=1 Tax=Microcella daejeonensis TaxID=2994971 RepID=A0A9E8MN92_9MICO|nr:RidA family protein [Microcella daejeonensis]WAB82514.1 RidA family protein [Microcella daejeonensis]